MTNKTYISWLKDKCPRCNDTRPKHVDGGTEERLPAYAVTECGGCGLTGRTLVYGPEEVSIDWDPRATALINVEQYDFLSKYIKSETMREAVYDYLFHVDTTGYALEQHYKLAPNTVKPSADRLVKRLTDARALVELGNGREQI